ncbi:MAG: diacylglyceryl transferase [Cryomorphaceae bacterium MED-G14]|nr:MAG: diacylglyceryl transferase [Cryomorphaceae bacterium MED-G14]
MKRIKDKWGIENNFQFAVILVVFAVTGSVSAKLSGPTAEYFEIDSLHAILYWPIRLLIVFPIYQILLIWFGFIFGVIVSVFTLQKDKFIFNFFFKMSILFSKKLANFLSFGLLFRE